MRVLAIGAHPDDLEILCGGTLTCLAARSATRDLAFLTRERYNRTGKEAQDVDRGSPD
jgi:LmbE family N-acetylglucosaminyl deacetylase